MERNRNDAADADALLVVRGNRALPLRNMECNRNDSADADALVVRGKLPLRHDGLNPATPW